MTGSPATAAESDRFTVRHLPARFIKLSVWGCSKQLHIQKINVMMIVYSHFHTWYKSVGADILG